MSYTAHVKHYDEDSKVTVVADLSFATGTEPTRRTALKFNPAGDAITTEVKALCAAAMAGVIKARDKFESKYRADLQANPVPGAPSPAQLRGLEDGLRCFETALTQLESAQMFAVKGIYAPKNAE